MWACISTILSQTSMLILRNIWHVGMYLNYLEPNFCAYSYGTGTLARIFMIWIVTYVGRALLEMAGLKERWRRL